MQSHIRAGLLNSQEAQRAAKIVNSCVHCGLCAAACPTYILDADERDSPRGRIYLINEMLEKNKPSAVTLRHLDRCLTCRACESACPSGVRYGELADIGRKAAEPARSPYSALKRRAISRFIGSPSFMKIAAAMAVATAPILPNGWRQHFKRRRHFRPRPHKRQVIIMEGCVEGALAPQTHAALADILDVIGIGVIRAPAAGCCGALRFHLNLQDAAIADIRRNVSAWTPLLKSQQAEAIVMTSSGCQQMLSEYDKLLPTDDARFVRERVYNIATLLDKEWHRLAPHLRAPKKPVVAYHSPCTMQNALKLDGIVEDLLVRAGYQTPPLAQKKMCCGSAGAYSILQSSRAKRLRAIKLQNLNAIGGTFASANIGCQMFLSGGDAPVAHWVELLANILPAPTSAIFNKS